MADVWDIASRGKFDKDVMFNGESVMSCPSMSEGSGGNSSHNRPSNYLIKSPGKPFRPCENHLSGYLKNGFFYRKIEGRRDSITGPSVMADFQTDGQSSSESKLE